MKKLGLMMLALGLCLTAVYVLNETPFGYSESAAYTPAPASAYLSPQAAPFARQEPKRDALVLFLHSYGSSPHDFARAADRLAGRYNILAPLLPGHGTSEADFQKSNFSQWYAAARTAYLEQRPRYARVYLVGFSLGGSLALKLGEEFAATQPPDGIVTISSPVFFNRLTQGAWQDWRLYLTRFLSWWMPVVAKKRVTENQDGADRIGYDGKDFPGQVHSFKLALHSIERQLPSLNSPILCLHSRGDRIIPFANLNYIQRHVSSPYRAARTFDLTRFGHSRHLLPLYHSTRDGVIDEIEQFLGRCETVR